MDKSIDNADHCFPRPGREWGCWEGMEGTAKGYRISY